MRRLLALVVAVLLGSALLVSCGEEESRGDGSPAGVRNLEFQSTTVDGNTFDGASLAGKPTVFWFWAPWCPTCRGQIDGVTALADQYGDRVNFVGVGSLDDAEAINDFAFEVPSAKIVDLSDVDGEVWRHFGVTAQSTYLVLDDSEDEVAVGYLSDDELTDVVEGLAG